MPARPVLWLLLAAIASAGLPARPVLAQGERQVPRTREQTTLSFAPVVKAAAPAVVNIYTRRVAERRTSPLFEDPLFRHFFGEALPFSSPRVQSSLGSGVIVAATGTIVTNAHVVRGASQIVVVLNDRREFDASLVVADPKTDLAIIRIDPKGETMPFLEFGDSDKIDVGDLVLAIGNPFGVGQTVTSGIISAVERTEVMRQTDIRTFIQTDAAINPGNSGGALIDMNGRLIGINTAIYSQTGASHGIGFAVPARLVMSTLAALTPGGRLIRPWFGASGTTVSADIAASVGLARPGGVLVESVFPEGPSDAGGLKRGDVILAVDGVSVQTEQALRYRVATVQIGATIRLNLWRGGRTREVIIRAEPPPERPAREETRIQGQNPFAGALVANLSPALADELSLESNNPRGVVVLEVAAGSSAQRLRLQRGDILLEANGQAIARVAELRTNLRPRDGIWRIKVKRGEEVMSLMIQS
jgi:Do/DeqQ family serine protease